LLRTVLGLTVASGRAAITGDSSVAGDLTADTISITGAAAIGGALTAASVVSSGLVQRLQHHCMAYMGVAQSLPPWASATNMTKLALGSSKDVRGTNPYNSATNRFVAPVSLSIRVNTVEVANSTGGALTHVLYLATTDYVETFVAHQYAGNEPVFTGETRTHVTMTSL
jgi:hypothetical protein